MQCYKKWTRLGLWHLHHPPSLRTTMSSRRFPWFPLLRLVPKIFKVKETKFKVSNEHRFRLGANFLTINCVQKLPENELAIVSPTAECTSEEDRDMETNSKAAVRGLIHILPYLTHIWIQKSSENFREVIPTTAQYIMATGKQALKVLQSAAVFIPVPLIREAIGVALKIMEVCEEQCEVCKIPLRKGCEMVNNILLPEYIRRR